MSVFLGAVQMTGFYLPVGGDVAYTAGSISYEANMGNIHIRGVPERDIGLWREPEKQRKRKYKPKPYETPRTAGERVQIDVKFVPKECLINEMPKLYQYTAVDECTGLRVRYIFDEHSNWNSIRFLNYVRKKMPFDIKCVQADNGTEFTTVLVCSVTKSEFERCLEHEGIKHKRIRSAITRHNGKVERVHRMDSERFYVKGTFYTVEDAKKQSQRYQR